MLNSPTRNKSNSPIRTLQDRSPRLLQVIREQQENENRMRRINLLSREPYRDFVMEENQRQADYASLRSYSSAYERDRLRQQVIDRDRTIEQLNRELTMASVRHQQIEKQLILQNSALKKQVAVISKKNFDDIDGLKAKYMSMVVQDSEFTRKNYSEDVRRLLNDLETTKELLVEKEKEIQHLNMLNHRNSQQYAGNLQKLIGENNLLRNQIRYCEINKDNEIRGVETKKQLEKSRTQGILSHCKETNLFIEKQLANLAEQLLEKNISIESFTKELMQKRKQQQTQERQYQHQIERLNQDHANQIDQKDQAYHKMEKYLKQETADLKVKEMELLERIASREHQLDTLSRDYQHLKDVLQQKGREIEQLKGDLSRIKDDHAKQINKVMNDSRIKRKSLKNLSSSVSSLKDVSSYTDLAAGQKSSAIVRKQSINSGIPNQDSYVLPTVREQLAKSSMLEGQDDEDLEIKQLVFHYESMIEQLKKNKSVELGVANDTIIKLKSSLQEKQQQVLDLLSKFSPLMELKMNQSSLQQERKNKIKEHYKADLDILSVMLDKYRIEALRKYK